MNIEKARQFLLLPEDLSKWDGDAWRMLRDPSTFLSVPWGEETDEIVALWNKMSPKDLTIAAVPDSAQTPAGFTHHLSCNGRSVDVPYRASREDCFVVVLSINELLKASVELRLSRVSTGNSDWCFMCGGQVISDTSIDRCFADSRSKALGDKFPSVECSRVQL